MNDAEHHSKLFVKAYEEFIGFGVAVGEGKKPLTAVHAGFRLWFHQSILL